MHRKRSAVILLGPTLCDTLKWNDNTNEIVSKASKRLHILRVLKRAGVPPVDLVIIYSALVRSVLEYSSVVWATSLPRFLIDQLEAIQKRALRIVYPDLHYQQALAQANITSLEDRRAPLCLKVWHNIKITRMASCTAFSLPCDPNATLTILGTVAVLASSSIEQNASVLVFSQQWRKLTNLTSLVISSIVLYLYLNCK